MGHDNHITPLLFGHSGCPRTRSLFQGGKNVAFKLWRMDAVGKMRKFEVCSNVGYTVTAGELY
ncbi:hypothetical protein NC651_035359 [Populus alba x Populus x berolinensis]|nr:hypothetical protein NC651_035359 [Populus alba x Populus x berolinensis]